MIFFSKKSEKKTYDRSNQKPVIKASICNGEQVAGYPHGKIRRSHADPQGRGS